MSTRRYAIGAACLLGAALPLPAQDDGPTTAVDFAEDVWPILEARCVDCHRAPYRDERGRMRQPKGGLRLDGKDWILRGGDGEDAVVAGDPAASGLYARTVLPADDPDVMPEEGDRLSKAETETIRRWIAAGADFGDWTGAATTADAPAPATAHVPTLVAELAALAAPLSPPAASSLETALGAHGRAEPLDPDGKLLRVSYPAHQPETDDRTVAALAAIRGHVAELDLARTAVGDRALDAASRMRHLVRLDLTGTAVTDRGLAALTGLEHLRSLVLVNTKVTDRGLEALAQLTSLRHVRLLGSGVTQAGVDALRRALPEADVRWRLRLPTDVR